jgi:Mn-dependent DtxR family transcriptional regulator
MSTAQEVRTELTALERTVLQSLAFWKDTRTDYTTEALSRSVDASQPRVLGALQGLRRMGYVRYFAGHPGLWAATRAGREELKR